MAVRPQITLSQKQRLALSPMMRQALSVLALPTAELTDWVAREIAENPFLLAEDGVPGNAGDRSAYDRALATSAAGESLNDELARQIAMQRLDPVTEAAALYLIGELREDGYLDTPLADLAGALDLPAAVLHGGLEALQRCEPAGIGARSLAECLELQLADAGIGRDLARAAVQWLDDFAEERWARLSRNLGQPEPVLRRLAQILRGLSARPVTRAPETAATRIPELVVERGPQDRLTVRLLPAAMPRLSVLAADRASLRGHELRALHDRAGWLISALSARSETLLRIGRHIVACQEAFFAGNHETIRPITRTEAAAALTMHLSTLGRALAGKALIAETRVYPLSIFFSRALPGAKGEVSVFDVQRRIRQMVAAEIPGAPLADDEIRTQLKNEGVDIARRTVAKYRKCMRIPSSYARRRRNGPVRDQAGDRPQGGRPK